ncbi:MAG TPA: hypothetical protein VIJ25_11505 [Methylococcales bacterium]
MIIIVEFTKPTQTVLPSWRITVADMHIVDVQAEAYCRLFIQLNNDVIDHKMHLNVNQT